MTQYYLGRGLHDLADRWPAAAEVFRELDVQALAYAGRLAGAVRIERASALGEALGRRLGPRLRQHRHILRNLRIAFPERDDGWIGATALAIWGRIFRTVAEYPHLPQLVGDTGDSRVEVVSQFDLGPARSGLQRLLLVGIHQANWNVHGVVGKIAGLPLTVVYGSQRNPRLEAIVADYRNRMPCAFIHVDTGTRGILTSLAQGYHVGTFIDARRDDYPLVPFFGHSTQTTLIPARLALKLGLTLVPVRLERLPHAHFRATLHAPLVPDPTITEHRLAAFEMTARMNALVEQWIRACPEDWICAKRRWTREIGPRGVSGRSGTRHGTSRSGLR